MTQEVDGAERTHRLNEPLVRVLMMGAGISSVAELARRIGVHKTTMGRALGGETEPSTGLLRGLTELWPLVPLALLLADDRETTEPWLAHMRAVLPMD